MTPTYTDRELRLMDRERKLLDQLGASRRHAINMHAQAREADERADAAEERAERLEAAIRRHHTRITKQNDWTADRDLWATLLLAVPATPICKALAA